jgi:cytochrome c553
MKPAFTHLVLIILLIASSCNSNQDSIQSIDSESIDMTKGFQLAESYCFTCHSPDAAIDANTSEEMFVADIINFVKHPSLETSKMPGAVSKFNLMPQMSFSDEDIKLIAQYIYRTEIEAPEWFEEHYQEEKKKYMNNTGEVLSYQELGLQYAMATKAVLGKNLLEAINTLGTEEALAFCNTKAILLTDSMAKIQGVEIKRVSDLNRNPNNSATEKELSYIIASKNKIKNEEELSPLVVELTDKVVGYYPILTNAMCLQCHGKVKTDIEAATLAKISELYPDDKATGYGIDELRGIWVVEIMK